MDVSVPCPGTGCQLFQDFTFKGISLWWAGVAYFAVMVLLCLRKARTLFMTLAALALCADAVLLIIMLGTASCIACLGAAFFMGLLFLVLRRHAYSKTAPDPGPSFIFLAWAGLFIAAVASAGTEHIGPWQMHGPENAERRIYFSPSCPACRDAVTVFAGNAAFIPVAERESDYDAIYRMNLAIKNGKTLVDALRAANKGTEAEPFSLETLFVRFRLLRNKAEVLGLGFDRLPLIMVNGMPRNLRPEGGAAPTRPGRADTSGLPPELAPVDSCSGSPEPCDTPPNMSPR